MPPDDERYGRGKSNRRSLLSVVDTLNHLFGIVLVLVGPYVVLYESDYRGLGIVFVLFGVWILFQQWIRPSDSRP